MEKFKDRAESIEKLAEMMAHKGYDGFFRIAGVSPSEDLRQCIYAHFNDRERLGIKGPSPPIRLHTVVEATSPDRPSSSIILLLSVDEAERVNVSGYQATRVACWEGEQLAALSVVTSRLEDIPSRQQLQQSLLAEELSRKAAIAQLREEEKQKRTVKVKRK